MVRWRSWLSHLSNTQKVPGSSPGRIILFLPLSRLLRVGKFFASEGGILTCQTDRAQVNPSFLLRFNSGLGMTAHVKMEVNVITTTHAMPGSALGGAEANPAAGCQCTSFDPESDTRGTIWGRGATLIVCTLCAQARRPTGTPLLNWPRWIPSQVRSNGRLLESNTRPWGNNGSRL